MRKERAEWAEKEEASKKNEATKDMVSWLSNGDQGCSKDVRRWRK
jgi:hypothetical protein